MSKICQITGKKATINDLYFCSNNIKVQDSDCLIIYYRSRWTIYF